VRVKSTFPNADGALWPGQFVNLRILVQTIVQALTVPSTALKRGPDGYFVYVVAKDGTASIRKVKPGPIADGRAVIETGLTVSDDVVTQGQYRLDEGTVVSTNDADTSTEATAKKE
jgi:membrane fusion protein, multidrug efflux system